MERPSLRDESKTGKDAGTRGKFLSVFGFVFIIF